MSLSTACLPCPSLQLTAGKDAKWEELEDMPYPRVLGDAVTLCDGTVLVVGGGGRGIAVRVIHPGYVAGWRARAACTHRPMGCLGVWFAGLPGQECTGFCLKARGPVQQCPHSCRI